MSLEFGVWTRNSEYGTKNRSMGSKFGVWDQNSEYGTRNRNMDSKFGAWNEKSEYGLKIRSMEREIGVWTQNSEYGTKNRSWAQMPSSFWRRQRPCLQKVSAGNGNQQRMKRTCHRCPPDFPASPATASHNIYSECNAHLSQSGYFFNKNSHPAHACLKVPDITAAAATIITVQRS